MVQGPSPAVIESLHTGTAEEQVTALKGVKNILVGHDQRKESAVKSGIIDPLAAILTAIPVADPQSRTEEWTTQDELRLQAALVTGSLAAAGPAFLAPLCAANIPKVLVETLRAGVPSRLVTAVLQALHALATFWSTTEQNTVDYDFWPTVFNVRSLETFIAILQQPGAANIHQLRLVAGLISTLPKNASGVKATITQCGILDIFASLLVAHSIDADIVLYHRNTAQLPPPRSAVPTILTAVSALISGSNYRAQCFILSPSVRETFMQTGVEPSERRPLFGPRDGFSNGQESLLPPLHVPSNKTVTHTLAANHFSASKMMSGSEQTDVPSELTKFSADLDHANAVCGWLLVLARSMQGFSRLTALRLLAYVAVAIAADPVGSAHKTEYQQKTRERERQLQMLAVPLAVKLVQAASENKTPEIESSSELRSIREQACTVLGLLIRNNQVLQVAAVDAGAIKSVCPILKRSFENVSLAKPMWSPTQHASDDIVLPNSRRMGRNNFPPEVLHVMRCRQSALNAITGLAAREDTHRKAIIEAGAVAFIIDSLKPFASHAAADAVKNRTPITPKDGNTEPVLLAACRAAQTMSRSVSILRTSLIDGGLAKPIIPLLHHHNLDIQVAATDVCCNLAPDFSPLREDLTQGNVMRTLAAHARSSSNALKIPSLWALKALMTSSPKDFKLATIEELGIGWLVDVIQGGQRDAASASANCGVSVGLSTANAAGEQVNLLNPPSMDVDERAEDAMEEDEDGEVLYDAASSTHYQASQLRSTISAPTSTFNPKKYLSCVREVEHSDEYAARRDEVAVQVQALDFLRNLLNGEDCLSFADHLVAQIGGTKLYQLLTAKLSPVPRTNSGGRPVYRPTELILSTIHMIIHLANASTKHRQMLIAQRPLMQAMLPHFNHLDPQVRTMNVWAVISLTFIEDARDSSGAEARSKELKAVGIDKAVRALQNDPVLDVRERVKTAMRHLDKL